MRRSALVAGGRWTVRTSTVPYMPRSIARDITILVIAVTLPTGACGGDAANATSAPFVGEWLWVLNDIQTYRTDVTFNADGTLDGIVSIDGCTGSASLSGQTWSATATKLTITGQATRCSGTLSCGTAGYCDMQNIVFVVLWEGSYSYQFSQKGNSLTLQQPPMTAALTRR